MRKKLTINKKYTKSIMEKIFKKKIKARENINNDSKLTWQ